MGPLAIALIISGLAVGAAVISDDDETLDEIETDDETEDPEVVLDTGASFTETEDGVELELGEDETGSLAVFHFTDTQDDPDDFVKVEEARFYLVPEGVDWSDASWETQHLVPGQEEFKEIEGNIHEDYSLEEFENFFGLELLGVVDLKDADDDDIDVVSNAPVDGYIVEAVTDGDYLSKFLPEDYVETRNGVPETSVFEDTTGTSGTDWFSADADDLTVNGAGGDDFLETANLNATLIGGGGDDVISSDGENSILRGGAGDDDLTANNANALLQGGDGDDQLTISNETVYGGNPNDDPVTTEGSGTAYGGDGDDYISGRGDAGMVLYGEAGNDRVVASGENVEGFGGTGDDVLSTLNGATVYGGAGNDVLYLDSGTTGDGGDGDDTIHVWNRLHNDDGQVVLSTGDGSDIVDVIVRSPYGGEADDVFLQVTDFDPEQDVLQVGDWGTGNKVGDIEIVEANDGSYSDVRVTYTWTTGADPGTAVIRLDGVTGLTADQIVITS